MRRCVAIALVIIGAAEPSAAQSSASLNGRVVDPSGSGIADAVISIMNSATGESRTTHSNSTGWYEIPSVSPSVYRVVVKADRFRPIVIDRLQLSVASTLVRDFEMVVGNFTEEMVVIGDAPLIERATISQGHVVDFQMIQESPLNGRNLLELGLLVPGSVTPPQNAFLAAPSRAQGFTGLNTAGNREDTSNIQINGVTLNDQVNNILTFQPPLDAVQEFRIDNALIDPEYSRNSGSVINIATKSGTNQLAGSIFGAFRDESMDARNFFERTESPAPFRREQFGGTLGGPILKNRTFFFLAFEGLRQMQGLTVNSVVPSDAERLMAQTATIARLLELLPHANVVDERGTSRFAGTAGVSVNTNRWALDLSHRLPGNNQLHGFYSIQRDRRPEPLLGGNTLPGFGDVRDGLRQIFTVGNTFAGGSTMVNETRGGFSRIRFDAVAAAALNPASFGIANGITEPIGLPQINVAGAFNFGSPAQIPTGRTDTEIVGAHRVTFTTGRHTVKAGGDLRRFLNNNIARDVGTITFPSVAAFLADRGTAFSIISGDRTSHISQAALGLFIQDSFRWRSNITFDLGLRYDWYVTPRERDGRFVVFDADSVSLVPVGRDEDVYRQNKKNFAPRAGMIWTAGKEGRLVIRGGYGVHFEQPLTNAVSLLPGNPPHGTPLSVSGAVSLSNAAAIARSSGISPASIDPNYTNGAMHSWDVAVERQLTRDTAASVAYIGSRGSHLRLTQNLNQPIAGVRPYTRLSESSAILPGSPLGNITQVGSAGSSRYDAMWMTATRRLRGGSQLTASYTLSRSLDTNSYSSPPAAVTVQNSLDIADSWALSDFDARHRFVFTGIYAFPPGGHWITDGWQVGAIVQLQSGNPVNIVMTDATISGLPNTVRPNLTDPIHIIGDVERWFDTSSFSPASTFGTLGRNVIIGPAFANTDVSVSRSLRANGTRVQLRADIFNVFNRPSFGQPGRIFGSPDFGRITNTRFPTGDSGSSRQIQLTVRVDFF